MSVLRMRMEDERFGCSRVHGVRESVSGLMGSKKKKKRNVVGDEKKKKRRNEERRK